MQFYDKISRETCNPVPMRMTLTNDVGSLLRIVDHSSQRCVALAVHARKWADMDIGVVHRPRRPLLLPR